jgi:hypothetical protein
MTTPYYTNEFSGQPGQLARAEAVSSEFTNVQSGFTAAQAFDLTTVHGQTGETLTALPIAASRANKWMKFDANGNPLIVASPWNPRGAWAANTAYNVGDAYTSTPNGSLYYVTTAYTSGSTFGATDLANTLQLTNLAGLFFTTPTIEIGPTTPTLNAGNSYGFDSTAGNIGAVLYSASLGDSPVNITYLAGSLTGSQLQTITTAAGQYIGPSSGGVTQINMDVSGNFSFQYWGATYGWRVRSLG